MDAVRGGGWRQGRSVESDSAPAGVAGGAGLCRRRTSGCLWVVRAQQLCGFLIRHATAVDPTWGGAVEVRVLVDRSDDEPSTCNVTVQVQANLLWRKGRVVFRCPCCLKSVSRLYVNVSRGPRCRRCSELGCESQQSATSYQSRVLGAAPIRRSGDGQRHGRHIK